MFSANISVQVRAAVFTDLASYLLTGACRIAWRSLPSLRRVATTFRVREVGHLLLGINRRVCTRSSHGGCRAWPWSGHCGGHEHDANAEYGKCDNQAS